MKMENYKYYKLTNTEGGIEFQYTDTINSIGDVISGFGEVAKVEETTEDYIEDYNDNMLPKVEEIKQLKQYLTDTDWVSAKMTEVGFENLGEKNKSIIEKRKEARAKINELEKEIEKFEVA